MSAGRNPGRTVRIDVLPQGMYRLADCDALVVIDVVLAGTLVTTALGQGRPTYLPGGLDAALRLRRELPNALFGQEGFDGLDGFEAIGPLRLGAAPESNEPLVLVVPWAVHLADADSRTAIYIGSLQNVGATARMLSQNHARVGIVGAGFRGEARSEDRIAAARLADALLRLGFRCDGMSTVQEIQSWALADLSLVSWGKSCDYLRREGRGADVDFILQHQDDINLACCYMPDGEVRGVLPANIHAGGSVVVPYVPRVAAAPDAAPASAEAEGVRRAGREPRGA
jgi:phosphosulfolactate phosphohydrolase-like enzyme